MINKRALHLTITNGTSMQELKRCVNIAALHRFNVIFLKLNKVKFNSSFIEKPDRALIGINDLKEIKKYIDKYHIKVIPHVPLLTHQKSQGIPDSLMFDEDTYNPSSNFIKGYVRSYLSEVIEIFEPEYIHIGHDELHGYRNDRQLERIDVKLNASEFGQSISEIISFLSNRGIKTIMWGDMFLEKEMFPAMYRNHLRGNEYFTIELEKLSRELVFCDYHYWDEKSIGTYKYFKSLGYDVYGVSWGDTANIALWVKTVIDTESNIEKRSLMAATFIGAIANRQLLLKNKGLDLVHIEDIISYSGKLFWNG